MKRILFVIPFLSSGGAERVVSIWSSELAKTGYDVHLVVFYRVNNEYKLNKNVKVHSIKQCKSEYSSLSKWEKINLLRRHFKEIKPNVVIPFITYVGMMSNLARIGLPLKLIETIRIDPRYSPNNPISRLLRNLSIFISSHCIVQNKKQLEYFPIWMQKRMTVLSNPLADEFVKNKKIYINKEVRSIVAVGRLEKQKNYPMLIRAFSQIAKNNKNITLNIYGEGSLYNYLNDYITQLNLNGRVFLRGRTENIVNIHKNSDLYILSSEAEGMPNSLMEAMAIGLPCISTDCPTGPGDLIENGVNGYLIPVGNEDSLVEAMSKMLNNVEKSMEMGKKARETVVGKYSADVSAKRLLTVIESIYHRK